MDQTSGTTPGAPHQAPDSSQPGGPEARVSPEAPSVSEARDASAGGAPGFGARGRVRRRARFLRKARELAYRDLGGLVFNLHRFGQRNDELVLNKLGTLAQIDAELRTLETALGEHDAVTVLREAGITACPRCAAIHSGDDHFCPNCGLSMSRHVDLPIAGSSPPASAPMPSRESPSAPPASAAPNAAPAPGAGATPPAPARGSRPSPPPASRPESSRAEAASAGRSPTPPTQRTTTPPAQRTTSPEAPTPAASSEEGEQTKVLRPLEPEK